MIEIPESAVLARQAGQTLAGRTIAAVFPPSSPHKFTWYNGDPLGYDRMLAGKKICSAEGFGAFVELVLQDDTRLLIGDGTNMRYYGPEERCPEKFQLALTWDDGACLVFTVAMYGGIYAYRGVFDNLYYRAAKSKVSPLDGRFDRAYFEALLAGEEKDVSVKAALATRQRIPGLGNGVLQDILFRAGVHPRRRISTLDGQDRENLFLSVKDTLAEMVAGGGRDTEKDLFGQAGKYRSVLSKNTYKLPCPVCGGAIVKEAYLGGAVYFCPNCQ